MIVRLTAVVLRLSALYFLWQTINLFGAFQFALGTEDDPIYGFVPMFVVFLLISAGLWIFARRLAPLFFPYEDQGDPLVNLDTDRLECVIIQITGLILFLFGLHACLIAVANAFIATIQYDGIPGGTVLLASFTRGLLFGVLGFVLLIRWQGILGWLRRLRQAGTS
jgi:hypothetical protein